MAFDGMYMWITSGDGKLTALSGGTMHGPFPVSHAGIAPEATKIAFDGTNMWVGVYDTTGSQLVMVSPSGLVVNTIAVQAPVGGLAFDGTNLWFTANDVTKLSLAGVKLFTYKGAGGPMAFDGQHMWVLNNGDVVEL
jgi:hypothetical protein